MLDILISFMSIIFIISIPVFLHELGHYLAARSVGIKVEKFYVGMNLFGLGIKKKINETEYGIGLFPIGGYVKVSGIIDENLDTKNESDEIKDYEFRSKNTFQKLWFLSAGVIMNFILSIFIFSNLFYFNGTRELIDEPIVYKVQESMLVFDENNDTTSVQSPASKLGLRADDIILRIDNNSIKTWTDIGMNIIDKPNSVILVTWENSNGVISSKEVEIEGVPSFDGERIIKKGVLGISGYTKHKDLSLIASFVLSVKETFNIIKSSFSGFKGIVTGQISLQYLSGIVGIAKEAGSVAKSSGFISLLALMAFISSNLGLINILPIPGLDGGHAAIAIFEGVIRKEIPNKVKLGIQFIGFIIIMSLFIFTIFNDIKNLMN
jgi:regulator of sigma E protease